VGLAMIAKEILDTVEDRETKDGYAGGNVQRALSVYLMNFWEAVSGEEALGESGLHRGAVTLVNSDR
jgi:hypothetical protein